MTRVVWAQDLDPWKNLGGAQQNDKAMMVEGIKRGHDIFPLTLENINAPVDPERDFIVLSNVSKFDPKKLGTIKNRYAVFHHDYWFACKWRLYYPMTDKCLSDCPQSPVWKPILERARLHIFLSPLHYKVHSAIFGNAVEPHILVPSAVDPDLFFDYGRERSGTGNVNGLISFKGRDSHLRYAKEHPEEKITFGGENERPQEQLPENCTYAGLQPDPMVEFYNRFETYMELPETPQPFNRTIVESYLSGCKIRGNELVGALSWPFFSQGRKAVADAMRAAPTQFWDAIESVI